MNFTTCNNHGIMVNVSNNPPYCECDIGFFDDNCSTLGIDLWGDGWYVFQYITFFVYLIIAIKNWFSFIKHLKKAYHV